MKVLKRRAEELHIVETSKKEICFSLFYDIQDPSEEEQYQPRSEKCYAYRFCTLLHEEEYMKVRKDGGYDELYYKTDVTEWVWLEEPKPYLLDNIHKDEYTPILIRREDVPFKN